MTRAEDAAACFNDFSAALGESAIINAVSVSVIVKRSVDVIDEEGNARHAAALVHALKGSLPAWSSGDLLTAPGGNLRLRQVVEDDGFVQKIEASPVA